MFVANQHRVSEKHESKECGFFGTTKKKSEHSPVDEPCGGEAAWFVNDHDVLIGALYNAEPSRATRRAGGGYVCSDTGAMRAII